MFLEVDNANFNVIFYIFDFLTNAPGVQVTIISLKLRAMLFEQPFLVTTY